MFMADQNTFPEKIKTLSAADCRQIARGLISYFQTDLEQLNISDDLTSQLEEIYIPLAAILKAKTKQKNTPLIVGVNGAQGSGKSTLCTLLKTILQEGFDLRVVILSIDDLYCTREERHDLAQSIHPLLATRGVPGTHDVRLGLSLFDQFSNQDAGQKIALPVFDKAIDDRSPEELWHSATTPCDLVLFEGWCVGAKPQEHSALTDPVNELESNEDAEGVWRRYVNQRLSSQYAELFARLDLLIMLQIPGMDSVFEWRNLQERKLASKHKGAGATRIMNPEELRRFIMHYERLTRHMLQEMPERADIVLRLNRNHRIEGVRINGDWREEASL
jgi:D-glycerate 3-kinase